MRAHSMVPAQQVRHARQQLIEHGVAPAQGIDDVVARSWNRSLAAGLSPVGRIHCHDNLAGRELQRTRSLNHDLLSHSEPVMEYLFEQVRQSHSMVILSDAQGVLMHTLGDMDFLGKAERVALMCGASWAENQRGTNAIGTALVMGSEIEIHGAEHYLDRNGFLTCAASPILSAQGKLMGVLDISGDHSHRHPHTLSLVGTAARMIENSLVLKACRNDIMLLLHSRPEGIGSVAQGVLAFSEDGWLLGGNRKGLELVGLRHADIRATCWSEIFEGRLEHLLARAGKSGDRPGVLRRIRGGELYVQVPGQPRPEVQVIRSRLAPPDALSAMDTGDAEWHACAQRARKVADKSIPMLVLGESGVGKDLFARAVHQVSNRRDRAFVAVNCAALPEHLIESELFGHAPGAFTGALKNGAAGRLREADGGTLFLDEIGDMPLSMQTRLLRVLQERQVVPVGSGTPVSVDFNLICATNQNLQQAVTQGKFRADLYYRINGLTMKLPALRERSDFQALVRVMLDACAPDLSIRIEPSLAEAMARYAWPGNLRQLNHVLRTAVALLDPHEFEIAWAHVSDDVRPDLEHLNGPDDARPPQNLSELSLRAIGLALENTRGNVSAAARQLGISRQTMYRKLNARSPVTRLQGQ